MDMETTSMVMTATATGSAAAATTTAMAMSMGSSACKISMLWNWYTIDACFLSNTWHITSRGMFAGSCIGVIFLVMSLEFLRRLSKEYDRYILRQYQLTYIPNAVPTSTQSTAPEQSYSKTAEPEVSKEVRSLKMSPFRPHILQQVVRATLHMLQFAVAYFVMLLAMYYNGYIIICIIIGAWR
ncbi:hypothetical protein EG329_010611 [Mollisiaceae sp. DMI_Dod_QoI]|nr:hypothetical protein EG329_010611 [Helotiales sp. DMI_Dod_QoI]